MNKKGLVYSSNGRRIKPTYSLDEKIIQKYMQLYDLTKREAIKKLQLLHMGIQLTCINKFENENQ